MAKKPKIAKGAKHKTEDGRNLTIKAVHATYDGEESASDIVICDLEGEGANWPMSRANVEALIS